MSRKRQRQWPPAAGSGEQHRFRCDQCERSFRERGHLQQHRDATGHHGRAAKNAHSRRSGKAGKRQHNETILQTSWPIPESKLQKSSAAGSRPDDNYGESSAFFEHVLMGSKALGEFRTTVGLDYTSHCFQSIEKSAPELFCLWLEPDALPQVNNTRWTDLLPRQPPHSHLQFWQHKYLQAIAKSFPAVVDSTEFLDLPIPALKQLLQQPACRSAMPYQQICVALERWADAQSTRKIALVDLLCEMPCPDEVIWAELPHRTVSCLQEVFPVCAVDDADRQCARLAAAMIAATLSGSPVSTSADLALVCASTGKRFDCHWEMLSAFSPVFTSMREHECRESCSNEVTIQSNEKPLQWMLDWMSSGSSEMLHNHIVVEVLQLAHLYDIQPLVDICGKRMQSLLGRWPELACEYWAVSNLFFHDQTHDQSSDCWVSLEQLCVQVLEENFEEISCCVHFLNLNFEQIVYLLQTDRLRCETECSVLLAVSQWVAHDRDARNTHIDMLVPLIRFVYMRQKELIEAEEDPNLNINPVFGFVLEGV